MPSVASVKKDLETLGTTGQEEILNYLANYMYWFKWLQFFYAEKDTVKTKLKFIHINYL